MGKRLHSQLSQDSLRKSKTGGVPIYMHFTFFVHLVSAEFEFSHVGF